MKLVFLVVLAFIVTINGNPLSRSCKCNAVSDTVHFPFHSFDLSSCKLCGCTNAAMVNCKEACRSSVETYAKTGCGKVTKGSIVKFSWEASTCSSGIGEEQYKCA